MAITGTTVPWAAEAGVVWNDIQRVRVLEIDAELRADLEPGAHARAIPASIARIVAMNPGPWAADEVAEPLAGGLGILLVEGLLLRRAGWGDRYGAELLGPGDLLRPWERDAPDATVPMRSQWRALTPVRLALLDARWAGRVAAWPSVAGALTGRALERAHRAVALMAITQVRRLDERIQLVLWLLAERFGRVHPDGVHLDLPLTHRTLAELAGARRPSVSAAVARLTRLDRLRQHDQTWVLLGEPPAALETVHAA